MQLIIDIFPIRVDYMKSNKEIEREQNVIIISNTEIIKLLDYNKYNQYRIDMPYKIMPRVYNPYKIMSIYSIKNSNDSVGIGELICLKYNDAESLKKIFAILNALYNFMPKTITTDFDKAQIKALKLCSNFINKLYIIILCFINPIQILNILTF